MACWRNLVTGAGLALLAALPSPAFAQRNQPFANHDFTGFQPVHLAMISVENPSLFEPPGNGRQAPVEKSGTLPTKQGLRLRLHTGLGNVHIFTDESGKVSYRVIIEAGSRDPGAERLVREIDLSGRQTPAGIVLNGQIPGRNFYGRLHITFEVHVPNRYNVETSTGAGNIDVQNIDGQLDLATGGGYIRVGNVAGTLRATTSGGHITAGNIDGDGILHTGGGHIHAGRILGVANLDTAGGNIHVDSALSGVTANTAGGQIDLGEAAGTIHAHTAGGPVRIEHIAGPTVLETDGGSVHLKQVDAPLQVSSATGGITAWFGNTAESGLADNAHKTSSPSQLISGEGDIVVYLPRELAVTVDAVVDRDDGYRILADSSLPFRVSYEDSGSAPHTVHRQGELNGGGEILQLKAVSGNIELRPSDSLTAMNSAYPASWTGTASEAIAVGNSKQMEQDGNPAGFIEEMFQRIEESWWGGVPIDSDELQKHLQHSVAPVYPQVARRAGIEGDVVLRAYVSSDGRVTNLKVLAGPPILARAAIEAVKQWRYHPLRINGRPPAW